MNSPTSWFLRRQCLRPKTIVFIFAFLPPFVRPENGSPLLQLLILGFIFNIGGTLVNIAVSFCAGSLARLLATSPRAARAFSLVSASLFVFWRHGW